MKQLNKQACINYYNLDHRQYNTVIETIEDYLTKIEAEDINDIDFRQCISLFGLLGELHPLLSDHEKWDNLGYSLIERIRGFIHQHFVEYLCLYDGMSMIGMFVNMMYKSSGHYEKLLNSLHELILLKLNQICQTAEKNLSVPSSHEFDVMHGLAGISVYLLQFSEDEQTKETLKGILRYFVSLTEKKTISGNEIPGWYVNGANQVTEEYRADYKNGSINYSLSHGIAGPLTILAMAYGREIQVQGHLQAIKLILAEYRSLGNDHEDGNYSWPGIISLEEYVDGNITDENYRMGWCYGNVGVLRSLYITGTEIADDELAAWAAKRFCMLALLDTEDYHLSSPILCHGYSGTATIFRLMYQDTNLPVLRVKFIDLLEKLLESYNPETPYGFSNIFWKTENGEQVKEVKNNNDFLEGASGCIMELAAYLKKDTMFEKMLLIK